MLIVVEHFDTFHHYFLISVYPPLYLTLTEQVRKEIVAGKSQREVSRKYGISRYTIQSWCGLRPETKLRQIAPLPKGRPRKTQTLEDYQKENKRLKMENQLLRDFLSLIERM